MRYQFEELETLNLDQFDYNELSDTHRKLANLEQILSTGQEQIEVIYDQDKSIHARLKNSVKSISSLLQFAPELTSVTTLLTEAQIQIEEAVYELRHFLENQADQLNSKKLKRN